MIFCKQSIYNRCSVKISLSDFAWFVTYFWTSFFIIFGAQNGEKSGIFDLRFLHVFWMAFIMDFYQKWSQSGSQNEETRRAFWHPKSILFCRGSFLGPLARFGSLSAPFWSLLVPFGLHFRLFWLHFWSKVLPRGTLSAEHLQINAGTSEEGTFSPAPWPS